VFVLPARNFGAHCNLSPGSGDLDFSRDGRPVPGHDEFWIAAHIIMGEQCAHSASTSGQRSFWV
jgi:hypothetical protein